MLEDAIAKAQNGKEAAPPPPETVKEIHVDAFITIEAIIHDFAAVVDFIAPLFFLLLNSIIQFGFNRIAIEILFLINFIITFIFFSFLL